MTDKKAIADADPIRIPRRQPKIVIIGAGPGGLCTAIKLKTAGYRDIRILEKCDGPGGTWRINTYPGCECDVPSAFYSFSFDPKPDWSKPYAPQREILRYMEEVVEKYGLADLISYDTPVVSASWNDETAEWRVSTAGGETIVGDVLVGALGQYNDINIPAIEGLGSFSGKVFHSARWDWSHSLAGKSVAVIGSAASAVQLIPEIAGEIARLTVFQRTPNWVLPKDNDEPFTEEQLEQFRADPSLVQAQRDTIFEWLESFISSDGDWVQENEQKGLEALKVVADPETRRRMVPDFPWGAKRPLFSNTFYQTFNLDHVALVTEPIARVAADAIVTADGSRYEVDTIVLATGFKADRFISAIDVTGRGGVSLSERWKDGAQAYLGSTVHGFPNMFQLYGPNTNNGSILFQIEQQAAYIVRQIDNLVENDLAWLDIKADHQDAYNREVQEGIAGRLIYQKHVNGYFRAESGRIVTQWPFNHTEFARRIAIDGIENYETGKLREAVAEEG